MLTNASYRLLGFVKGSWTLVTRGDTAYWAWLIVLAALIVSGVAAYVRQAGHGLVVTAMRDQVSWGFYIGNFTFLVGVAAAAVVLVIPAYVYHWKPIREIVIFGELLAVSAIIMCLLFVGAVATYAGVYIEKGMGLIVPGLTPDTLGEIYEYYPSLNEVRVAAGIFAIGFLVFTLMLKVAVPILMGEFQAERDPNALAVPANAPLRPIGARSSGS